GAGSPAYAPTWLRTRPNGAAPASSSSTPRHSRFAGPGSPRYRPDTTMSQRPRFRAHQQAALPFVQVREDRLELGHEHLSGFLHHAHTTPTNEIPESFGLFSASPYLNGIETR